MEGNKAWARRLSVLAFVFVIVERFLLFGLFKSGFPQISTRIGGRGFLFYFCTLHSALCTLTVLYNGVTNALRRYVTALRTRYEPRQ
jgi:hypothetical protein